jgi:uncharacterized protein YdhG (YjbR/CyaY superfamily)
LDKKGSRPSSVDEYISQFPEDIQDILQKIRAVINQSVPGISERISYQMPGFYLNGMVVWFAVHKNHIGFYPKGSGIEVFKTELSGYKFSKGAVQFPLNKPIPYELISKMVKYNVAENLKK